MTLRSLIVNFGADVSGFTQGSAEVKKQLSGLNSDFYKNNAQLKELNKEYATAGKELKTLEAEMKAAGTATQEQKERQAALTQAMETGAVKIGSLKAEQTDLRTKISAANKELKDQNEDLGKSSGQADRAAGSISGLATAVKALVMGYTGKKLSDFFIGSNAQMEQYATNFEVMLGSGEKAKKLMEDIFAFSGRPILGMEGTVKNAELLLNYGVAAEDVVDKMTQLGNLAKGNAATLDRVSLAYGQMLAKGKVTGEEMRQMTEAGVSLWQALADTMGLSVAEVQKLQESGKVGIPELDAAIASMTTGTGKFAGLMEAQTHTLKGMLAMLSEELQQVGRDAGENGFGVVKDTVEDLLETIKKARADGTLEEITNDLGGAVSAVSSLLGGAVKLAWEYRDAIVAGTAAMVAYKTAMTIIDALEEFKRAQHAATLSQAALNAVMSANPIALVAAALAGVTVAMIAMSDKGDGLAETLSKLNKETGELEGKLRDLESGSTGALIEYDRTATALVPKIEELGEKANRSAAEQALLEQHVAEVNRVLGYEAYHIDATTGALAGNTTEIYKNIAALKERARAEAAYDMLKDAQTQLIEAQQAEADAKKKMADDPYDYGNWLGFFGNQSALQAEDQYRLALEAKDAAEKNVAEIEGIYTKALENQQDVADQSATIDQKAVAAKGDSYDELKWLRDADLISEAEYIARLTVMRDAAQGNDEATYRKYYLEIYNLQKASQKESLASAKSYQQEASKELTSFLTASKQAYDKQYSRRKDAIKDSYDEQIKAVEAYAKAEETRINSAISLIDKEIAARQRLKEETSLQKQMDAVEAQLKYAQLDEFSRRELERQLAALREEQTEQQWQYDQADKKAALKDELAAVKEATAARKEALKEEQEEALAALDKQKERIQEVFDYIGDNFTSLSQLQAAGISGISDLFILATANSNVAIQDTFALLQSGTQTIGDLYARTVNDSVASTFDYGVDLAKKALAELRAAIGLANDAAADLRSAAREARSTTTNSYSTQNNVNINGSNMTQQQVDRAIDKATGSKYQY